MKSVRSKDGTAIAFDRSVSGPALPLVDGALCHRGFGPMPSITKLLASHFTVFNYDRRGRGQSSDTPPYAIEREVEDIEALIQEGGGSAYVFGASSGAALALEAAARLKTIRKVALYEAPFFFDDIHPPRPKDYLATMSALIATDRRCDALKLFMKTVGSRSIFIAVMRFTAIWSRLIAVARTLAYELTILADTRAASPLAPERWTSVTMSVLTAVGGKSPTWWQDARRALAAAPPNAQHRTLPGQTHMLKAKVLAPLLVEFFGPPTQDKHLSLALAV